MKIPIMKNFLIRISFFSILALSMTTLQAQPGCTFNIDTQQWEGVDGGPCVNTIITAVPFLRIVPDARAGAMGDTGIATSPDANSLHFNGSKLAFAEKDLGISVTYTPWLRALNLNDVYLAYLSGYKQINKLQSVGLSLRYFSLGSIDFTDENGMARGTGRPNEFEVNFTYARQLSPKLAVGLGGKFIYSNLAAGQTIGDVEITPGTAGAADISLTYKTPIKLSGNKTDFVLGIALTNLGTKISYTNSINRDFIPANLGLGAGWTFNIDEYNSLTAAFDINKLLVPTPSEEDLDNNDIPDYREEATVGAIFGSFGDAPNGFSEELKELMYSFGLEYWYDKQFAVRAGYYSEHATKGNRKFFTVGLGLKYNIFGLNFSYLIPTSAQRNPLDNTLRFSLLFDFAAFDADEE